MNDGELRVLAAHEVEMAGWRLEAVERRITAEGRVTPCGAGVWGAAADVDELVDATAACAALTEFAPRPWWRRDPP